MNSIHSNRAATDSADAVQAACDVLRRGGVVVYPTETLYGLGVDATQDVALQRLVTLKVRQEGKPISVLVSDRDMLASLVSDVPPPAQRLIDAFWPGPLTIVFEARPGLSDILTGGSGRIGVRISSHALATALVAALGRPLTSPSANPAGARPPVTVGAARDYFGAQVDYYLDAGALPGEPPSTVVDVGAGMRVLREGAISSAALTRALEGPSKQDG